MNTSNNFHLLPGLDRRVKQAPRTLSFQNYFKGDDSNARASYGIWKKMLLDKLVQLLGLPATRSVAGPFWGIPEEFEYGTVRRFTFSPEPETHVPAYLVIPRNIPSPLPLAICLQGHRSGMHISLGWPKYDGDIDVIKDGCDYAIQALKANCAALVLEQRGFGERRYGVKELDETRCHHASMNALVTGRTMIGERVLDVMSAIDIVQNLPEIDSSRIFCIGDSGGGTISYYAAAVDSRICLTAPSCSVCEYGDSIMPIHHCACNYIPHALEWFEISDLAGLIAPRPLVISAGRKDPIFPYEGVLRSYANIEKIYRAAGAVDRCALVTGSEGHRSYPEETWPVVREFLCKTSSEA